MTGGLTLSDTDGLDEDLVEAGSLAEDDGLTRLTGHATEGASRRTGANEGVGMLGEFLHARLITEDATLGALTGGVDGEHGQTASLLTQDMHAELVDARGLACTGNATDAHTHATAAVGQTLVDDLLGTGLMVGVDTLD